MWVYIIINTNYFNFTFNEENHTATLTGIKEEYKIDGAIVDGDTKITNIVIPKTVQNNGAEYTVTVIGSAAFVDCNSIQEVNIPDGVTELGGSAFRNCSSLQTVNIPDSVTSIGMSAFYGCSSIQEIHIPDGVTRIAAYSFGGCTSLQEINIPSSVTTIGPDAFSGCDNLKTIFINKAEGSLTGEKCGADNATVVWLGTSQ